MFEVEYLENGTKKRDVFRRSQIGSHTWAFGWYKFFRPQMTFRSKRSGSNPKNFEVEYLENGTR